MPSVSIHLKFDKYLTDREVLLQHKSYRVVHTFIDRGIYLYGSQHREIDPYHDIRKNAIALRTWINGKYAIVGPNIATDFLRTGFGHFALDNVDRKLIRTYKWISKFDSAYRSMVQRGWHKKFFKPF